MDELSAFHQFYDDMIHGICIVRTDGTDAIVYANKRMLAMYDCQTEKEFLALAERHVQGSAGLESISDHGWECACDVSFYAMPMRLTTPAICLCSGREQACG